MAGVGGVGPVDPKNIFLEKVGEEVDLGLKRTSFEGESLEEKVTEIFQEALSESRNMEEFKKGLEELKVNGQMVMFFCCSGPEKAFSNDQIERIAKIAGEIFSSHVSPHRGGEETPSSIPGVRKELQDFDESALIEARVRQEDRRHTSTEGKTLETRRDLDEQGLERSLRGPGLSREQPPKLSFEQNVKIWRENGQKALSPVLSQEERFQARNSNYAMLAGLISDTENISDDFLKSFIKETKISLDGGFLNNNWEDGDNLKDRMLSLRPGLHGLLLKHEMLKALEQENPAALSSVGRPDGGLDKIEKAFGDLCKKCDGDPEQILDQADAVIDAVQTSGHTKKLAKRILGLTTDVSPNRPVPATVLPNKEDLQRSIQASIRERRFQRDNIRHLEEALNKAYSPPTLGLEDLYIKFHNALNEKVRSGLPGRVAFSLKQKAVEVLNENHRARIDERWASDCEDKPRPGSEEPATPMGRPFKQDEVKKRGMKCIRTPGFYQPDVRKRWEVRNQTLQQMLGKFKGLDPNLSKIGKVGKGEAGIDPYYGTDLSQAEQAAEGKIVVAKNLEEALGQLGVEGEDLKALQQVRVYRQSSTDPRAPGEMRGPNQALGRFDVIQTPCKMEKDAQWNDSKGPNKTFMMHHGAAINIGEGSDDAKKEFEEYRRPDGGLDTEKYLRDTEKIFENMLRAQANGGAKHVVWVPFGMGAFLRNLDQMDPSYKDPQKMMELREEIAKKFVVAAAKFPDLQVHMCLPETKEGGKPNNENNQNLNAFVKAFSENSSVPNRVWIRINEDATEVAQDLANEHDGAVSLANGANRNRIANHYHGTGAFNAVDENAHRRSPLAAAAAFLVNIGLYDRFPPPRTPAKSDFR